MKQFFIPLQITGDNFAGFSGIPAAGKLKWEGVRSRPGGTEQEAARSCSQPGCLLLSCVAGRALEKTFHTHC